MKKLLLLLLLFPSLLCAAVDSLFPEEENLCLVHHVNVISGHLNLTFQDTVIQGAKPLPIWRSYTSEGGLGDEEEESDRVSRLAEGWLLRSGWNFLPEVPLLIETGNTSSEDAVYAYEPSGTQIRYTFSRVESEGTKKNKRTIECFQAAFDGGKSSGALGAKNNPAHNTLRLDSDKSRATLFLPDGGTRHYAHVDGFAKYLTPIRAYCLQKIVYPNRHQLIYHYDKHGQLEGLSLMNPAGSKTFASFRLNQEKSERKDRPKSCVRFIVDTSDGKSLDYRSVNIHKKNYLNSVESNCRPRESSHFLPGMPEKAARMQSLNLGGATQFMVHYHGPCSKKQEKWWLEKPKKRTPFFVDRVKRLDIPCGPRGEMHPIAHFSYPSPTLTDVRDSENILTRYHHDQKRLLAIEYFDTQDRLYSSLKLLWATNQLAAKVMCDSAGTPLFSRTFTYDDKGNVLEEVLFGNLTGERTAPFSLEPSGALTGADSLRKRYQYLPTYNLPILEEEEDGLTYRYSYKENTDLLTAKLTCVQDKILIREFFLYDADHLLIAESIDDGSTPNPNDLTGVTERRITRYQRHPTSGLPIATIQSYLDLATGQEELLKKTLHTYGPRHLITEEAVYDATDTYRYTLHTTYDPFDRLTSKTTPTGEKNSYLYSAEGRLLESKEVGSPKKIYTYTATGQPLSCQNVFPSGTTKTLHTHYDTKGRLLSYTDTRGNPITQTYDALGRCLSTQFPTLLDETKTPYTPTIHFSYDIQGNLTSTTTPRHETTTTTYNTLKKPVLITQADGTQILHTYNKNGTLATTRYPDDTEDHFTYDPFQRPTSKTTYASDHTPLVQETWSYNAFHLLTHTDPRGLITTYTYDGAGRKIQETAEDRTTTYHYDPLGFLERTSTSDISHITLHDPSGRLVEEWTEDTTGRIENRMRFVYNSENKKEKALRLTSQGEATDLFTYDDENRLSSHTDPLGALTTFHYQELQDDCGQTLLQKITTDPIHNHTLETYDPAGHLISCEKQSPKGATLFLDHFLYDRAGNRALRLTTIYDKDRPLRHSTTTWEYDALSRPIKQVEEHDRTTLYGYDSRGNLIRKTLPSGIQLFHTYDGLNRLLQTKSTDGTIHDERRYEDSQDPTTFYDHIHHTTLKRQYNPFGQITDENNNNFHTHWDYDDHGRCTRLTLPDNSSINYHYDGLHLTRVQRHTYQHTYNQFDPNGHVTQETLLTNTTLHTTHDLLERPSHQTSTPLTLSIRYGPSGLITHTHNTLSGDKTYAYDPLNQLTQEEDHTYAFDSLGNPTHCTIGPHNQILSTPTATLTYDPDGNPLTHATTTYTYDALGRLTTLTTPDHTTTYTYDPLSRLLSKHTKTPHHVQRSFYLYDQDKEIGTLSAAGDILELKVLGLGLQADIGAAIALEIHGQLFAPLHDLTGNLIALLTPDGTLLETYLIHAFGQEQTPIPPTSPWRFCSKRAEEGLIFFGKRFYDPSLGRWLTPDPAGFVDSPNLYLYVLNSPQNRLDLFGLAARYPWSPDSEGNSNWSIDVPIQALTSPSFTSHIIECHGHIDGVQVDWIVHSHHWHKLQFSAEEVKNGTVNIVDHFSEMLPKEGLIVGLITCQNGINTTLKEFRTMSQTIVNQVPEGTLFLGLHNPSYGLPKDLFRTFKELRSEETPTIQRTKQMFTALADTLPNINPELLWVHINHSEAGLIAKRAIDSMSDDQRSRLHPHLHSIGLGPAAPMPKTHCRDAINIYSNKDNITKRFAEPFLNNPNYDIRIVPCITERLIPFIGDHFFSGETYQEALGDQLSQIRKMHTFYDASTR